MDRGSTPLVSTNLEYPMPIIAFVGDTHYRFRKMYYDLLFWQSRTGIKLDAIVHVGDFGVDLNKTEWRELWNDLKYVPIKTYVCMGNHEDWESIAKWQAEPNRIRDLHLMPDGCVTDVAGLQIACIWGNYSPKSWRKPEVIETVRKMYPASLKATHIYKPAVDNLLAYEGRVDVLVTHDCSTVIVPRGFGGKPVPEGLMPFMGLDPDEKVPPGCPGITQVVNKFQPQYHFYGHFHVRDYRELGTTKVICLHAYDFNATEAVEIVDFKLKTDNST